MLSSITLKVVFVVLALVCFALSFFGVGRFSWRDGGFFFLTLAIFA